MENLKRENEILKRLLKDGHILMNFDSRDCDGCSTSKVVKFNSLEELYKEEENCAEWADGPFNFSIPRINEDGSLDLNDEYCGGQWDGYYN